MKKKHLSLGGGVHETVPASRQNIDPRTPSGVRPVNSPVIPIRSDVVGAMKHGGEPGKMKWTDYMRRGGNVALKAPVKAAVPAKVRAAPVKAKPVKAQAKPIKAAPIKAAPIKAAPIKAAPVKARPVKAQAKPVKTAPAKAALASRGTGKGIAPGLNQMQRPTKAAAPRPVNPVKAAPPVSAAKPVSPPVLAPKPAPRPMLAPKPLVNAAPALAPAPTPTPALRPAPPATPAYTGTAFGRGGIAKRNSKVKAMAEGGLTNQLAPRSGAKPIQGQYPSQGSNNMVRNMNPNMNPNMRPGRGPGTGKGQGPGQGQGQGKGMGPGQGQGKGPVPGGQGKGPVPGGFMGGGAGQGKGMGPGGKPGDLRYTMGGMGPGALGPQGLPNAMMGMNQMGVGRGGPELGIGEGKGSAPGRGRGLPNAMMGMNNQNSPEYANFMTQRMAQRQAPQPMASMVGASGRAPGMKKGGKVSASSYNDMTGGAGGGMGRLQKTSIASKTKTQKLKKGGKVKGYADGGLSKADVFAMTGKYEDPADDNGRREKAMAAYKARQDAAEKAARKPKLSPMKMEATPSVPRPKVVPNKGDDRIRTDRPRSPSQASSDPFTIDMRRMSDPIKEYQRTHDRYGRKLDENGNPLDYAGNPIKTKKKGGKIEAFEGSAKDMAQDKKLARKYGMTKKAYEKSPIDAKHDKQRSMKGLKMGGMAKMAAGGMSTAQDGMKGALRPKPTAMAMGGYAKGGKAEMHPKGCKCMPCGGKVKMAKGGKVTFGSLKSLPGTKTVGPMRSTTATGASMKKDGMKGQLRAKASGAKTSSMMKPLGMTKMAAGGKVRGAGIAQRGTKFIGEV